MTLLKVLSGPSSPDLGLRIHCVANESPYGAGRRRPAAGFAYVPLGVEDDDVDLGHAQADERPTGRQSV